MTVLITSVNNKAYILTAGAYTIQVYCSDFFLNVYAGKAGLGAGRTFHQGTTVERLAAAAKSYKAAAVKSALKALADHLA